MKQRIIEGKASYQKIGEVIGELGAKKFLLVYTEPVKYLPVWEYINALDIPAVGFCEFTSNPKYEEVEAGVITLAPATCTFIVI